MADQEILQVDDTNKPNDAAEAEKNDPSTPPDASEPEAFVNNGLEKWLAAREAWCKRPSTTNTSNDDNDEQKSDEHKHAIPVDVDGIIDVLFDPRWRGGAGGKVKISPVPPRFPKNVPLPQMIDVLTDLWEAEGLDV